MADNAQEKEDLMEVIVVSSVYEQFPFWCDSSGTHVVDAWITTNKEDLSDQTSMSKLRFNFTDPEQATEFWQDASSHPFLIAIPPEVLETPIE